MIKYKIFLPILFLLWACDNQIKGFDNTSYDLYKESQFANGFALIKDQYGKRLDPHHNEAPHYLYHQALFGMYASNRYSISQARVPFRHKYPYCIMQPSVW